jgi:hypothetical protein
MCILDAVVAMVRREFAMAVRFHPHALERMAERGVSLIGVYWPGMIG